MKNFSEFSQEAVPLEGEKEKLENIIDQEIVVVGCRIRHSRFSKNVFGEYLTLQFNRDGKLFVCFTGSDVLIDQMKKYEKEIPFQTTIKKIHRYFTFT